MCITPRSKSITIVLHFKQKLNAIPNNVIILKPMPNPILPTFINTQQVPIPIDEKRIIIL